MDIILIIIIFIFGYLITLCILRGNLYKSRLQNKAYSNCCPNCHEPLDRSKRKTTDYMINLLTIHFFGFKRFVCNACGWNGLLAKYSKKVKSR